MSTNMFTTAYRHWTSINPGKARQIASSTQDQIINPQHAAFWRGIHKKSSPYSKDSVLHAIWKAGRTWQSFLEKSNV